GPRPPTGLPGATGTGPEHDAGSVVRPARGTPCEPRPCGVPRRRPEPPRRPAAARYPTRPPASRHGFVAGDGLEARALTPEVQLHDPGGAIPLLTDDEFGLALDLSLLRFCRRHVVLRAIKEHDQIGVLLQRAGLPEIGELGSV